MRRIGRDGFPSYYLTHELFFEYYIKIKFNLYFFLFFIYILNKTVCPNLHIFTFDRSALWLFGVQLTWLQYQHFTLTNMTMPHSKQLISYLRYILLYLIKCSLDYLILLI